VENDGYGHWSIIMWRFEAIFPSGEKLLAFESHSRRRGQHYRKIVYRFMKENGELICQVDPHQNAIPFEACPHIHVGPTESNRLEDGHWKLNGYSLRDYDFLRMWDLVTTYLEDGSVPWRT
jgi:hypothetical protein